MTDGGDCLRVVPASQFREGVVEEVHPKNQALVREMMRVFDNPELAMPRKSGWSMDMWRMQAALHAVAAAATIEMIFAEGEDDGETDQAPAV